MVSHGYYEVKEEEEEDCSQQGYGWPDLQITWADILVDLSPTYDLVVVTHHIVVQETQPLPTHWLDQKIFGYYIIPTPPDPDLHFFQAPMGFVWVN